jgi:hyperosmotically inducible periplasmic protein
MIARPTVRPSPLLALLSVAMVLALALVQAACSKTTPSPGLPVAVQPAMPSDADVTAAVQSLLGGDGQLQAYPIGVSTSQGEVHLTGTLDTQVQIDHALALTRATVGVRSVKDGLLRRPA